MENKELHRLMARYQKFPLNLRGHSIEQELGVLQMTNDKLLAEHVDAYLDNLYASYAECPFLEPDPKAGLTEGEVPLATTRSEQLIRISFNAGMPNRVWHLGLFGMTGVGKSSLQANIAINAAASCFTFLNDVERFYRNIPAMHTHHKFIRWTDLRLNFFDVPEGVMANQIHQVAISELCRNYRLEFAEYEINEVVGNLRKSGTPNLPIILDQLKNKKTTGFSKRSMYRDSAILVIQNLLDATGELFRCSEGMNILDLVSNNIVLETDGLLAEHQRVLMRFILEYLHLCALNHKRLAKPLLFVIDEAQKIVCE